MQKDKDRCCTNGRNGKPKQADAYLLLLQHGGRCAMCNLPLTENPNLFIRGNYAEIAHVIAASKKGPRSDVDLSKEKRHAIENLIPLCPLDHKMVDDDPEKFPIEHLLKIKKDHANQIKFLTGLADLPRTLVIRCQINLGTQLVRASPSEAALALIGRCPLDSAGLELDFSILKGDETPEMLKALASQIDSMVVDRFNRGIYKASVNHVSVFAMGPIPLLVSLGRSIGSAIETAYFHRDRASNSWKWPTDGSSVDFAFRQITSPSVLSDDTTVVVSCSGPLRLDDLPEPLRSSCIYEIYPNGTSPSLHLIQHPESVHKFIKTFNELKTKIRAENGHSKRVNLLMAAPPCICVATGQALLPKVDPAFMIYDLRKTAGTFVPTIEVNT